MQDIFSANILECGPLLSSGFFLRCRSRVMPLRKTKLKSWAAWIGAAFGMLGLLLAAETASAAPCDVKNNAPPSIRHDLTDSYCELCRYGYITIAVANPYDAAHMTAMTVVENLGSSGLTCDPTAPNPVRYSVNGDPLQVGSAPIIGGGGSTLTFTSAQVPGLSLLETRPVNNQSNTINALVANNGVLPGGSPCLVASNNIVDFIVTGDFAACTSNCPWGDTYERHANTSVYLGGKIWTCR